MAIDTKMQKKKQQQGTRYEITKIILDEKMIHRSREREQTYLIRIRGGRGLNQFEVMRSKLRF